MMDLYSCGVVGLFSFGPLLLLHLATSPQKVNGKEEQQVLWGSNAVVPVAVTALIAHCAEYAVLKWALACVALGLFLCIMLQKLGAADDQSILSIFAIARAHGKTDFTSFLRSHREALLEGNKTGNYVPGVCNYYRLMADVITICSGPFWHFVPMTKGLSRKQCHDKFHHTTCEYLDAKPTDKILEFGCGFGEIGRQVAKISGANVTGLTMADEEIEGGTARIKKAGLESQCKMVQGNYHDMNMFADCSFDKVFGIYTLKYSADLDAAIKEMARVLKPGGRFLSYEIIVTDKYDKNNKEHKQMVDNISISTCMPPLWHAQAFRDAAEKAGLRLKEETDLCAPASEDGWYTPFEKTGVYYIISSNVITQLTYFAEKVLRILPKGFAEFYEQCLIHPAKDFVDTGRLGIVNGAVMMVWEKP
jgi:sterol 24-C-methyltransferase|mmetsp:Transcript_5994/g.9756  ORF Transcript_5994/g.9756 Transcript_5994/m.9756 type:complete len:419 (+) Transcript_5994:108-1364(+)